MLVVLPLDLLAQDGDARLEVRTADVDHDALTEARAQAFFQLLQLARRPVAGDDDLLAGLVEGVEGVEELHLGLLLLHEELHVVDEEHVVLAVGLLEALDAVLVGDRVDEVVGEALDGDVLDLHLRVLLERGVGDRLDEVGLAEPGVGVHEDGVVRGGRRLRHAVRHGRRVLVVRARDEAVEHVPRVQVAGGLGASGRAGRLDGGASSPRRGRRRRRRRGGSAAADCCGSSAARSSTTTRTSTVSPRTSLERLRDLPREALLDPVAGEVVGHADDEGAVVEAERQRAVEPELEGRFVEAPAKVLLRLVPDESQLVVRARPISSVPGDAAAHRGCLRPSVRGCSRGGEGPPRARLACRRRASVSTPCPAVQRAPGRPSRRRCRALWRSPWGPTTRAP